MSEEEKFEKTPRKAFREDLPYQSKKGSVRISIFKE